MKITFRILLLAIVFFAATGYTLAQKRPDTLVVVVKKGKIILVSDLLQQFNGIKADDLIKRALLAIKDSLTAEEKVVQKKTNRDAMYSKILKNRFPIRILPVLGLGLLRNQVAPFLGLSVDFAPQRQDYYYKKGGAYTFINVAVNPYFTFREGASGYGTQKHVFIEATLGNRMNNDLGYKKFSEISAGLGYLVHTEGPYFSKQTFKIFANIGLRNTFIKIRPALYVTNSFREVFPAIGIKLF